MDEQGVNLVLGIITATLSSGIMLTLGKLLGSVKRYGTRLDKHSGQIEANQAAIVRLDTLLPERIKTIIDRLDNIDQTLKEMRDERRGERRGAN